MSEPREPKPGELQVSLHGPNVQMEDMAEVGEATKKLLEAVAEAKGIEGISWAVGDIRFRCDGCGLELPDRPSDDAGWTNDGTNDYCPECSKDAAPGFRPSSAQSEDAGVGNEPGSGAA